MTVDDDTGELKQYTHNGLVFEVTDAGPASSRVVILLHGFPEDRQCWTALSELLVSAGYRTIAPDQRGYSPGARPVGRRSYSMGDLCSDILALADAAGADQFDVVGHDWGAGVAWNLAASAPERVRSLCALSVPHPRAFTASFAKSSQALRSWYMYFFQLPKLPERVLAARGGSMLEASLVRSGLDRQTSERYAARAADLKAMSGPINWYRAIPFDVRHPPGKVKIPTLFFWGDQEKFVTKAAAEGCERWVTGLYKYVVLPGRTHWLPTTAFREIAPVLLEHLASAGE
jgi:pimeloyl-ACP methyl ester carboxylesterase